MHERLWRHIESTVKMKVTYGVQPMEGIADESYMHELTFTEGNASRGTTRKQIKQIRASLRMTEAEYPMNTQRVSVWSGDMYVSFITLGRWSDGSFTHPNPWHDKWGEAVTNISGGIRLRPSNQIMAVGDALLMKPDCCGTAVVKDIDFFTTSPLDGDDWRDVLSKRLGGYVWCKI